MKKPISIIVAMADNNAIGKDNKLLFYLPADLKWFKENTTGKKILMGRKTFESLPNGALPDRVNIVITRNPKFKAQNAIVVHSVDEALQIFDNDRENFVIGGAEIYKLFLPYATKLYITRIYAQAEADSFFPKIDFSQWQLIERIDKQVDDRNKYDFTFFVYKKK